VKVRGKERDVPLSSKIKKNQSSAKKNEILLKKSKRKNGTSDDGEKESK